MKQRSLAAATVLGHLAKALEEGYFVDYRKGRNLLLNGVIVCNCVCVCMCLCVCVCVCVLVQPV